MSALTLRAWPVPSSEARGEMTGHLLAVDRGEDFAGIESVDGADITEIDRVAVLAFHRRIFVAEKHTFSGQSDGAAAETVDGFGPMPA